MLVKFDLEKELSYPYSHKSTFKYISEANIQPKHFPISANGGMG